MQLTSFFRKIIWLIAFLGPTPAYAQPEYLHSWAVDESVKVLPHDIPKNENILWSKTKPVISLFGAKNEVVAFQIVLRSDKPLNGMDILAGELRDGRHYNIPKQQVALFRELYLQVTDHPQPKIATLGSGVFPEPLVPWFDPYGSGKKIAAPFKLDPDKNQPVWIDITIPDNTVAGVYNGKLTVLSEGKPLDTFLITLTVWDFALPKAWHLSAYIPLYETRLAIGEGFNESDYPNESAWRIVKQYMIMAHQHRFVTQVIDGRDNPDIQWNPDGTIRSIDWSVYDHFMGTVLDGSLFEDHVAPDTWKVGPFIWWGCRPGDVSFGNCDFQKNTHLSSETANALAYYAKAAADHFLEKKWNIQNIFMYFIDEPDFKEHPNFKSLIVDYGDAIHLKTKQIKHLVTTSPDQFPEGVGTIDIWAGSAADYIPVSMQSQKKKGDQTWVYQYHPPFIGGSNINDEGIGFRTWPWIAWKYRIDGIFLWVGDFWNDEPYRVARNWNEDLQGNGVMFFPGGKLHTIGIPDIAGPIPSFRMKAWRRGMQDYEYLWLIKQSGKEGGADRIVEKLVYSALNHGGYRPYWKDPFWSRPGNWNHDSNQWELARQEMALAILKARSAK